MSCVDRIFRHPQLSGICCDTPGRLTASKSLGLRVVITFLVWIIEGLPSLYLVRIDPNLRVVLRGG